tara:strand:- start:315 stop:602 length:288 start_codon:yes stop_codon:yes gene_type:complete
MKINHETKIEISIVTDFIAKSLENQIIIKRLVRIKDILNFINELEKENDIKTSIYENSFLACFCESIVCVKLLDTSISWDDIVSYKNIYSYYERM